MPKQKNRTQLNVKQNPGATIKIHNSKILSNLDLPHSLVFNVFFSSLNFCVSDIKYMNNRKQAWSRAIEHDGLYLVSRPSPRRANYPSWQRSPNHVHLLQQFVTKQARWAPIFSQVFAKNSLIKNIFEKEKKFDCRTWFLGENNFVFGVFGSRRGLQANQGTVRKSAISLKPGNPKRIKWSNTVYLNKRSFIFKIKFCFSSNKDLIL